MTADDWSAPLQPLATSGEAWEQAADETEQDAEGEGTLEEELILDDPIVRTRLRLCRGAGDRAE